MLVSVHGTIINLDHVRSIEDAGRPSRTTAPGRSLLTFSDGKTMVVPCSVDWFASMLGRTVPAPPGYKVIKASPAMADDPHPSFWVTDVIAFRLSSGYGEALVPITIEGEPSEACHYGIIYPDGRCDMPFDRVFESVDAFKVDFEQSFAPVPATA